MHNKNKELFNTIVIFNVIHVYVYKNVKINVQTLQQGVTNGVDTITAMVYTYNEMHHGKACLMPYANSKGSDQTAHNVQCG